MVALTDNREIKILEEKNKRYRAKELILKTEILVKLEQKKQKKIAKRGRTIDSIHKYSYRLIENIHIGEDKREADKNKK